jgi:hydrogenase small subunit
LLGFVLFPGNSAAQEKLSSSNLSEFLKQYETNFSLLDGVYRELAEDALERVVREHKGEFIAVVEGAIPTADDGVYCTIAGRTALDIARHVCTSSAFNIAVGACAWDGGLVRSSPNPTGALGLEEAVPGLKVVNLGGCPHNPANTAAVLVHYLTFHDLPALDQYNRPLFAYGNIIHDQCERRAHYDAGRFVEEWGDEGHRKGYCLYKMGCKGPEATFNCPVVRWNDGTSWPVKSGHGCIACASHRFWDTKSPFYKPLPSVPGFGVDVDAGTLGLYLTGGVAAGLGLPARRGRKCGLPAKNHGAVPPRLPRTAAWWNAKGRRKNHRSK